MTGDLSEQVSSFAAGCVLVPLLCVGRSGPAGYERRGVVSTKRPPLPILYCSPSSTSEAVDAILGRDQRGEWRFDSLGGHRDARTEPAVKIRPCTSFS